MFEHFNSVGSLSAETDFSYDQLFVSLFMARSSAARVSSAVAKKKHLIEVAPFGRLDQMLRTTVKGEAGGAKGGWGGFAPPDPAP